MHIITTKRLGSIIAIFGMGLLHLVVAFGNLTDYPTNFEFVKHVLSMDTLFPQTTVVYRAFTQTWIHQLCYVLIIATELIIGALFLSASFTMYRNRKGDLSSFQQAKKTAYLGVAVGLLLWLIAFTVVAGEWFSMWQSIQWNATATARTHVLMLLLIYLSLVIVE